MSAPACGCGKALEGLRGSVAEALGLLDEGHADGAGRVLRAALATSAAPPAGRIDEATSPQVEAHDGPRPDRCDSPCASV